MSKIKASITEFKGHPLLRLENEDGSKFFQFGKTKANLLKEALEKKADIIDWFLTQVEEIQRKKKEGEKVEGTEL